MLTARAYSVFSHLGGALWLRHDPSRSFFMIYTAYYDASSKEEKVDAPLVVAGIASTEEKWIQFEDDWTRVLRTYDVEFLDMAKCAQWQGHPYNTWKRSENYRRPFLCGLIEALANAALQVAVVRILPTDYHAVNARYCLANEYFQGPYATAAIRCMGLMEQELRAGTEANPMAHIVEEGDTGQGAVAMLGAKGFAVAVRPKQDPRTGQWFQPFGAADMVAYEYRKQTQGRMNDDARPFRASLVSLWMKIPTRWVYISQQNLIDMCEALPDVHPKRAKGGV